MESTLTLYFVGKNAKNASHGSVYLSRDDAEEAAYKQLAGPVPPYIYELTLALNELVDYFEISPSYGEPNAG